MRNHQRRRLNNEFRSWLTTRMWETGLHKLDEWLDRFEVVAGFLSHTDKRCLDLQAVAEDSGYAERLLRETVRKVGERFDLIQRDTDHEGTWYTLKVDPFTAPDGREVGEERERVESPMERLYRSSNDEVKAGINGVIKNLQDLSREVEPAVVALVMDVMVDLTALSGLMTQISSAGARKDPKSYLEATRGERIKAVRKILKESE